MEQQKQYKIFLDSQVELKNAQKNQRGKNEVQVSDNFRQPIKKDRNVMSNPYSTKNYEFGGTALNNNPITNPVNSYQFDYSKYRDQPTPQQRETPSARERMRNVGNNIMK